MEEKYKLIDENTLYIKDINDLQFNETQSDFDISKITKIIFADDLKIITNLNLKIFKNLKEVKLPKNLEIIEESAFEGYEFGGSKLEIIEIPDSVKYIGSRAFAYCYNLKEVKLPKNLEKIVISTFNGSGIEKIEIPDSVKEIEFKAFANCKNLKEVKLSKNLERIEERAFFETGIEKIEIPDSVKEIGGGAFSYCENLKEVKLPKFLEKIEGSAFRETGIEAIEIPDSVKEIGASAFSDCSNLKEVQLPKNLGKIDDATFLGTNIEKIEIPDSVKEIGRGAFSYCENLKEVKLPKLLEKIEGSAFEESPFKVNKLEKIEIPDSVKEIGSRAFYECRNLKEVKLPKNLEKIGDQAFYNTNIEKIEIPDSVKEMGNCAFAGCKNLKEAKIALNLEKSMKEFIYFNNSRDFYLEYKGENIHFIDDLYNNEEKSRVILTKDGDCIKFHADGSKEDILLKKDYESKINKWNRLGEFSTIENILKLKNWIGYKAIPHKIIVQNMNAKDLPLFYKDNNAKNWQEVLNYKEKDNKANEEKNSFIKNDVNKASLFHIAYMLGLFSEDSERAKTFIKKYIIDKYTPNEIHEKFSSINTYQSGYNEDFARFFMFNFLLDENSFHKIIGEDDIDFLGNIYNNFDKILKAFPNKKMTTHINSKDREKGINFEDDKNRLLPKEAIDYLLEIKYEKVDERAKDLAKQIATYGYEQKDFEKAQAMYLKGLQIPKDSITLEASKDEMIQEEPEMLINGIENKEVKHSPITYELLEKSDALGLVVGNITNCCQIINGVGEKCLEYGVTQPNSGFLVFRNEGVVMGQAWVWYDEKTKIVCLDNIEVPDKQIKRLQANKDLQNEFINSVVRASKGFVLAMGTDKVKKVTIGKGYNDINFLLSKHFKEDKNAQTLTNYSGYTDANKQYIVYDGKKYEKQEIREV